MEKFEDMVRKEPSLGYVHRLAKESQRMLARYALKFEGKLGVQPQYTGRILAVGIAYDRTDVRKRHACKVEVLRERLMR